MPDQAFTSGTRPTGCHPGSGERHCRRARQEAIQDAGKHAWTGSEILVRVDHSEDRLRLRVSDGGVGHRIGAVGEGTAGPQCSR